MAKKRLIIQALVIAAMLVAVFMPGIVKYHAMQVKNREYQRQIRSLETENRRLLEDKRRLETDPVFIEKEAREKMGVVKKGEIVYKVVNEKEKEPPSAR